MKKPAPISMSVAKKPPAAKPKEPVTSAPGPVHDRIVSRIVKDEALERRVSRLEASEDKEIIVKVEPPPRPRITSVRIKYDPFGAPTELIPSYSE